MNIPRGVVDVNATPGPSEVGINFRAWEFKLTRTFDACGGPIGAERAHSTTAMPEKMESQQCVAIGGFTTCSSLLSSNKATLRSYAQLAIMSSPTFPGVEAKHLPGSAFVRRKSIHPCLSGAKCLGFYFYCNRLNDYANI